jgi:fucose permease
MKLSLLKKPSAFVPLLMSLAALTLLVGYMVTGPHAPNLVTENGVTREDEGAVAHIWQLLMGLQFPIIFFFAVRWLPRRTQEAVAVLGMQFVAGVAAAFPVWYVEHVLKRP